MLLILFTAIMLMMYVRFNKAKSVSVIIVLLLTFTALGSSLVGQMPDFEAMEDILVLLYTCLMIFLFCDGYKGYTKVYAITGTENNLFVLFSKLVLVCSLFSVIVNGALLTVVFPMMSNMGEWKGDFDAQADFFYRLPIPHWILTLSSMFSSFAIFALPIHFHYLVARNLKMAIWYGLCSLALIVNGLLIFSRSSFVIFALLYLFYLFIFYDAFSIRTKKFIKKLIIVAVSGASIVFMAISINRFDDTGALKIQEGSIIQNELLYSFFDYACQWFSDNFVLGRQYNNDPLGGTLSNAFINDWFLHPDVKEIRLQLWGSRATAFIGLFCIWLYDFGYIVSIMIAFLFRLVVRKLRPKRGVMSSTSIFAFSVLSVLPLMSFTGNMLEVTWYHYSLIILALYALLSPKYKIHVSDSGLSNNCNTTIYK